MACYGSVTLLFALICFDVLMLECRVPRDFSGPLRERLKEASPSGSRVVIALSSYYLRRRLMALSMTCSGSSALGR
jgi:hypothetical protein